MLKGKIIYDLLLNHEKLQLWFVSIFLFVFQMETMSGTDFLVFYVNIRL